MRKLKIFLIFITTLLSIGVIYLIYRVSQPTEIIGIHDGYVIVVKNFPLTNHGKIEWWEKNKKYLKQRYDIPRTESDGHLSFVAVMDIGGGYQENAPKSWVLSRDYNYFNYFICFKDMQIKENCIEKNTLMVIYHNQEGRVYFRF